MPAVIVATNFSETSREAIQVAAALARKRELALWLVHVQPEASVRALGAPVQRAAEKALADEASRIEGLRVRWAAHAGALDEVVRHLAGEQRAELVVVGAPRQTQRMMGLGGSLDRLVARTSHPVLVVREAAPFLRWLEGPEPLRVVVGVDRSQSYQAARAWLDTLASFGPLHLTGGHVFYPLEETQRRGLPPPTAYDEVMPELREELIREVKALLPRQPDGAPAHVALATGVGRAADHLVELAQEDGAALLVLGTHQRRGLGKLWSVSHQVLRSAPMAVAAIPLPAAPEAAARPLPRIRRVLVATDFSVLGNLAVPYAFAQVESDGEVHLIHVDPAATDADLADRLRQKLQALVPLEARDKRLKVRLEVITSGNETLPERIAQAAERHDVDLVCLGSHGRSVLGEALLGSVAHGVITRVKRPVLVVRGPVQ